MDNTAKRLNFDAQQFGETKSFEVAVLPGMLQRQRWVTEIRYGAVQKSALIIDPDLFSNVDDLRIQFEQVREILVRAFGAPTRRLGRGISEPGSVSDRVNRGDFLDITEWDLAEGTLRLGIPQRLDGQIRIEAQFAVKHPAVADTRWSIEEVN